MLYKNFDCFVGAGNNANPNVYQVHVISSPAGEAKGEVQIDFSELRFEDLILHTSASRAKPRPTRSPALKAVQDFGERLFKSFFKDEVANCFERSLDEIQRRGAKLRLRLRLTHAPKLMELPWEYLRHPTRKFLFLSDHASLVRYLEVSQSIQPLRVRLPLRALVMIAAPRDVSQLDVEQEWSNLNTAMQDLKAQSWFEIDRLENATLYALNEKLREKDYHIFHFIGHGSFDPATQTGGVFLEDEEHNAHFVSGEDLANVLRNEKDTLRLVILNACEGARTSCHDAFAGTAQKIIEQSIPAVVAMQFAITDAAAVMFTEEFYRRLAQGLSLDQILSETRQALDNRNHKLEWATPVLYMRTPDSNIFEIEARPPQDGYERLYAMQTLLAVLHHLNSLPKELNGLSITELAEALGIGRRKILFETLRDEKNAGLIEQVHVKENTFWKISERGRKAVSRLQESLGVWIQSKSK